MKYFHILVSSILFTFCSVVSAQVFSNGVYVLNEGGFSAGNATVSFISNANELQNNIFSTVNSGNSLGDTAQHMAFDGTRAYIALNGSGSIRVVNRYTFELEETITGFVNPRYIAFYQGSLFVSCWGDPVNSLDDYVAVVDLATNLITNTISVAEGPERMIEKNGKIYVAHFGGYGFGATVSIIDAFTLMVLSTIDVGDVPNSLAENNGVLYVLCGGKPSWSGAETFGSLVKYDLNTNSTLATIAYPNQHPSNLRIDGENLYYSSENGIYKTIVSFLIVPNVPLITTVNQQGVYGVYGLDIIDSNIYVADAGNFSSQGSAYVYSNDGALLNTFTVGVIPNGFYKAVTNLAVSDFNSSSNIIAYPNPTNDSFYLNTEKQASLKMFDITGRLVKTENYDGTAIDVLGLKNGIYLIEIRIENQTITKTIIVN
jgi:hypothetical protein